MCPTVSPSGSEVLIVFQVIKCADRSSRVGEDNDVDVLIYDNGILTAPSRASD